MDFRSLFQIRIPRSVRGYKSVVNDSHGTGYAIHRKDMILAGKTGTAEIKESQSDTTGTELGGLLL